MTEQQNILLALVRMALWRRSETLPEKISDWNGILHLANQQTLMGLVADAVPMLPPYLQPEPQVKLRLHAFATKVAQTHSVLNRKIADITARLNSIGVHTVLFKGQGTALNYPNPLSRQCGDIDLYVGTKSFGSVLNYLNPISSKAPSYYKHSKHFKIVEDSVTIEIHRIAEILPGIRKNKKFQQWTASNLESSSVRTVEINGVFVNLPPADFDAIYIMNHAWHHFVNGGIGLRQICDWTMHMHRFHNQISTSTLKNNLASFGLLRAWKTISCLAVNHLGLPASECPLYDPSYSSDADKILETIWQEGNFGFHSKYRKVVRPAGHFAGKVHSFKLSTLRVKRIISISPFDVVHSWIHYVITGALNIFKRTDLTT